jgi:hypothetical protein
VQFSSIYAYYGAGIAQSVQRLAGEVESLSLLHSVQTSSGAHPTSFPKGTGGTFLVVGRLERQDDHSPPSSAEAKKVGVSPPLPLTY